MVRSIACDFYEVLSNSVDVAGGDDDDKMSLSNSDAGDDAND
jgi:hypothetical protein